MKTIGMIGGMSWESSIEYYRIINEKVKEKLGGLHSAKSVMYSVDFAGIETLQHAGRWEEATHAMIEAARHIEVGGAAYLPLLEKLQFDRLAGLPYAAIPIATAISLAGNFPMIYPRKEVKPYGTKAEIEGEYQAGETIVVIDDLATTGGSKFEAIEKLTGAGLVVKDVVVLVDRQSGAKESLAEAGYVMHAVLTISEMLDHWEMTRKVAEEKIEATREFLSASG